MNVVLHVGPGKTGSSAIQKWMNEHANRLLAQGYFYPQHLLDENGISSGNALSVYEYERSGALRFNEEKARRLLSECKRNFCHTLILSSEAFIARYEPLLEFFKSVKVVFYLRNPLDCAESLYNQSVKRHFNTEIIRPPRIGYERLIQLNKHIQQMPESTLEVRLYGKEFFSGGDIISDFLEAIKLKPTPEAVSSVVNHSYSFEALEFKRALNFFPSVEFHRQLDKCLQAYQAGSRNFSLLSPAMYKRSVEMACECMSTLEKVIGISLDKMSNAIAGQTQKEPMVQELQTQQITALLNYIAEQQPMLLQDIRFIVEKALLPMPINSLFAEALSAFELSELKVRQPLSLFKMKRPKSHHLEITPMEDFNALVSKLSVGNNDKIAERLREIALYFASKGDYLEAFRFMQSAKLKRTHGKIINQKLKDYSERIMNECRSFRK